MSGSGVTFFGDWERYFELLDGGKFRARLVHNMTVAHERIGTYLVGEMRKAIRRGDYAPNSAFTVAMKGSSKPLVDIGDLVRLLNFDVEPSGFGVMVGVKRNAPGKQGQDPVSIARALHDGFTLQVTPAIRRAVFAKLRQEGRAPLPATGAPAKSVWVIPPRPFILDPVTTDTAQNRVLGFWRQAYLASLRGGRLAGGVGAAA